MSVKKYEETLPVEEMVEKAMKAMEMSYSPIPGFEWEPVFLRLTETIIPAATLKMQAIPQATVRSAPRFSRQSARVCWNLMPSAWWAA